MTNIAITATGFCLPKRVLSNNDIIQEFGLDVDDAWIVSRTGIRQRHWLEEGLTTSDMAVAVARDILARRNISPQLLDRIILATASGDYPSPATAAIVAQKLETRCSAFDISAACAGFLFALEVGAGAIRNGDRYVLVLAADARSRFINKYDRRGVALFADGAAGVLLEPSNTNGILSMFTGTDGHRKSLGAWIPAGGAVNPTTAETVANGEHYLHVDALTDIFPMFVARVQEAVDIALSKAGLGLDDIDVFIPHQGNAHLIDRIIEALNFPAERTINFVESHGNASGAALPIALAEAIELGKIRPGHRVLMASCGAGNTFGAVVHQF